jgi:predicted secreted protein
VNAETIDVTNMDSSGWRELLDGTKSWEFTAEALWLSTATTSKQDELRTALSSGTRQWFKFQNSTAAGSQTFQGWGYVSRWNLTADQSDVQIHNLSISGDGSIAES